LITEGEAGETGGLLAHSQAVQPEPVLLDWELPGHPVADLLASLRARRGG
jgi:hypothetical protein